MVARIKYLTEKGAIALLRLILGRAGSGKTQYVRRLLADFAEGGGNGAILIVPEQFSFESERAMLEMLGEKNNGRIEVLSFSRLADAVFREYGGKTGTMIDESGKAVLMSLALESLTEKLRLYSGSKISAVVPELVSLRSELKRGSVSLPALMTAAEGMEECLLREKLRELSMIFSVYDSLLEKNFLDDDDTLSRLGDALEKHDFFKGRLVVLDSFKGFTAQEMRILGQITAQSRECYITLCCDSLHDEKSGAGTFSPVKKVGGKLVNEAKRLGVSVAAPIVLRENPRFKNPALKVLEERIYDPAADAFEGEAEEVSVCSCRDMRDECDYTARAVKKLLRVNKMRCRDIAVVARNMEESRAELEAAFEKYGIPMFPDGRKPISSQPLVSFVRSCIAAVKGGFETGAIFGAAKTGLTDLSVEEVSELENYVLMWEISGKRWLAPFTSNPGGLMQETTDKTEKALARLNKSREALINPLIAFKNGAEGDGAQFARAVYFLLINMHVDKNLKKFAVQLEADGETALAAEQDRIWDMLMEVLDQSAGVLSGYNAGIKRFGELFEMMIGARTLGSLPQGLDVVNVGSADRVRMNSPAAVFIIGANDGVFPAVPTSSGILSDSDRRRLSLMGLEVSEPCEERAVEEQFLAYTTAAAPSRMLTVIYGEKLPDGSAAMPSSLVSEIRRILPNCKICDSSDGGALEKIESYRSAFDIYCSEKSVSGALEGVLGDIIKKNPEYSARLACAERAAERAEAAFTDGAVSKALFGENMYLSASAIESFYTCRFRYFCQRGLKLNEERKAELDPMSRGTVIHYVLEQLLKKYSGRSVCSLNEEEMKSETEALLTAYLEEAMGGSGEKSERFMFLYSRLLENLLSLIKRLSEEFAVSDFLPEDFELKLNYDGDIPPYELNIPGCGKAVITGSVDRVDLMRKDEKAYIRVVDYKSGGKTFKLSDVFGGLNMQMLIYLMDIWKNGGERYGDIVPSGVLYMSAALPSPSLPRNASEGDIEREMNAAYRMNGIVLRDSNVLEGMEKDLAGKFIPVKMDEKKGVTGSLIGIEELERLCKLIDSQVEEMVRMLHSGDVAARPAYGSNYKNTCQWCPYAAVCGHEEDSPVRELPSMTAAECLKILRTEEEL